MYKRFSRGLFSLRFTQWSRKSYAVFRSIGKHITIGNLKNIVADILLGKQKNTVTTFCQAAETEEGRVQNRSEEPPDNLLLLELIPIPVIQQEVIYCKKRKINHSLLSVAESNVLYNCFQPFYLKTKFKHEERNYYSIGIIAGYYFKKRNSTGRNNS